MSKKRFYSELFRRYIFNTEENYDKYVKAELLFRIDRLKEANCSCMKCKSDLDKYLKYYDKIFKKKHTVIKE